MAELVGWTDPVQVAAEWFDAPADADELGRLLEAAHEALEPYAPAIPLNTDGTPGPIPARYAQAQVLMAKHIFARGKAGNADTIGPDGYQVSTYPLVLEARSLLRPKRGNPFGGVL